jgi:hypothetical protein
MMNRPIMFGFLVVIPLVISCGDDVGGVPSQGVEDKKPNMTREYSTCTNLGNVYASRHVNDGSFVERSAFLPPNFSHYFYSRDDIVILLVDSTRGDIEGISFYVVSTDHNGEYLFDMTYTGNSGKSYREVISTRVGMWHFKDPVQPLSEIYVGIVSISENTIYPLIIHIEIIFEKCVPR